MTVRFAYHPATFFRTSKPLSRETILSACDTLWAIGWRGIEISYKEVSELWQDPGEYRRDGL
jgi:hypothetical protein